MIILISDAFDAEMPKRLAKFGEVTDDAARLPEAEVVLVRSKTKCKGDWWDKAANVKLIIRGGVGLDNIDQDEAKKRGVMVRNTAAASAISVAELAMALMLAVPAKLMMGHVGMARGEWLKKQCKRTELHNKTLGLVGVGNIGREVATRAKAFGMTVIGYDPYVKSDDVVELVDLETLKQRADVLSLHTPFTPETDKMINADFLGGLKDGAIIVNTSRGEVVDEPAVVAALDSGKLAGYGNDVWYSDPPENSPLVGHDKVVHTPHIGGSSAENMGRIGVIAEQLIADFAKG
jgi:D-3-phosphoglycerate dehydrogenase